MSANAGSHKIRVKCGSCGATGRVTPSRMAKEITCPRCQSKNTFRRDLTPAPRKTPSAPATSCVTPAALPAVSNEPLIIAREADVCTEKPTACEDAVSLPTFAAPAQGEAGAPRKCATEAVEPVGSVTATPIAAVPIPAPMTRSMVTPIPATPVPIPSATGAVFATPVTPVTPAPSTPSTPAEPVGTKTAVLEAVDLVPQNLPKASRDPLDDTTVPADMMALITASESLLFFERPSKRTRRERMTAAILRMLMLAAPFAVFAPASWLAGLAVGWTVALAVILYAIRRQCANVCVVVTDARILVRAGFFKATTRMLPKDAIRAFHPKEGFVDRRAGTGTLVLTLTNPPRNAEDQAASQTEHQAEDHSAHQAEDQAEEQARPLPRSMTLKHLVNHERIMRAAMG